MTLKYLEFQRRAKMPTPLRLTWNIVLEKVASAMFSGPLGSMISKFLLSKGLRIH
jgi:hypothetical protein